MIQVVKRIGAIFDSLAEHPQGATLKSIEQATALNKSTLCNLLKSLCDIGYVQQCRKGAYALGEKLVRLAYPGFVKDTLFTIASEITHLLAEETRESGVVVIRHENELQVIAREVYDQDIVINVRMFDSLPGYHTAIGYIFMAFDSELDIEGIYERELKPIYPSKAEFLRVIEQVRTDGVSRLHIADRHAYALAVPVYHNETLTAALGMVVPDIRYDSTHGDDLVAALVQYGRRMSRFLS